MKHFFAALLVSGLTVVSAAAQVRPPAPPANLQGVALRDWLRQNWYDGLRVDLGYSDARGKMYNYVDVFNGQLTCVYSGYSVPKTIDSTSTSTANVGRINCEHTIPQSWFNEVSRMRSDIHHLYPTYDTWNSNRGSDPFGEIQDSRTTLWMRGTTSQSSIPTSNIDEWSEDTNTMFEPREDHKGNLARSAFYFYTMHANEAFDTGKGVITALADLQTLYQWHLADPVDAHERERNRRTAKAQGNFNPYISDPSLVARAWGFLPVGPTVTFAAASGSIVEGNTGTSTYTATLTVSPAPTSTVTVQVSVDAANSTATAPGDYSFATQTVTFNAGQTSQTVSVTINGDTQPEPNETVRLVLGATSTGLSVGAPNAHDLTITNDDGQPPLVSFASATGSIVEGNAGTSTYTVNVTLSGAAPTGAFTLPITVDAAGSTAGAADYTLNTTSLSFGAGVASQPVTLTINGDTQVEPNETVRLVLGTPSGGGVSISAPTSHVLTITNDDGPVVGPGGPGNCQELFFSEYVESSGATRAVEIYNPTPNAVNLTGYRLLRFANGSRTPQTPYSLSGTIAPGGTYVVATTGSVAAVTAVANVTNNVVDFNGDDAMALFNGTDTLDIIGVIGQQLNWPVTGGTTLNNTLRRLPTVGAGSLRWSSAAAGWTAVGVDDFSGLGSHSSTACATTGTVKTLALGAGIQVFPNPATASVQLRLPGLTGRHAASIGLYDALGREVLRTERSLSGAEPTALALPALPAGLYSVRVTVAGVQYTARLAVQR
ncbi:T9SS type A sorting domain-containing protein [Hymenobacter gummosus]|uniref:T9SS type A sorting domain-containing protein n=1 Tax=Hymenobacter gummosus TaxID=1776032 RepID=A0A3S0J5C7_9BACT|nr:endonuclease [Hymenobacter gummosus]RTQ44887.1 T9SS type A sorting domain-containing protein [Hymenobacter gummosus]